jgi:multidrug resistance protein, MATE family
VYGLRRVALTERTRNIEFHARRVWPAKPQLCGAGPQYATALSPVAQPSIPRRLFNLASPIIGINVLNVSTLVVDTAMCGRLDNADIALAALGYATQVVFLLMVVMMGLTVGTVALVARAFGARDPVRVNHVLEQATTITALFGLAAALAGNLLVGPLLAALGTSDQVAAVAISYLRPLLSGAIFYYLTIFYGGVLRGVGNTRLPFVVALLSNSLNVVLDYGLIFGKLGLPELGVQGAGVGTVLSYAANVAITVALLRRGAVPILGAPLLPRPIDRRLVADLLRVGAPAALDAFILNIAFLSIVGMLGRIDEVAVAAHGIGLRIQALAFVPGMSISQATGAMVGQALGAGNVPEARQILRASVLLCVGLMTTLGFSIIAAAYPLVAVFHVAPATPLENYAVLWMQFLGYCMPVVGVYIAFVGLLQGAGATNVSLSINFVGTFLLQVPLGALLGFSLEMGAAGVWLSFPLSFVVKATLGWLAYKRGRWAKVGLHA